MEISMLVSHYVIYICNLVLTRSFSFIFVSQVVSTGPNPEWDESFVWSFESPPKGQKLHISCKNKSKMGKVSLSTQASFQIYYW